MYPNNANYMSNNQYYPYYGRNYGNYQMPNYTQPMQQMPQMKQQNQGVVFQDIKFLTEDEIKAYIVMPNTSEMLIDMSNHIVHIKSADVMGKSSEKLYKFEEVDANGNVLPESGNNPPNLDLSAYAKTDDLSNFVSNDAFKAFSKNLDDKLDKLERKLKIKQLEDKE